VEEVEGGGEQTRVTDEQGRKEEESQSSSRPEEGLSSKASINLDPGEEEKHKTPEEEPTTTAKPINITL